MSSWNLTTTSLFQGHKWKPFKCYIFVKISQLCCFILCKHKFQWPKLILGLGVFPSTWHVIIFNKERTCLNRANAVFLNLLIWWTTLVNFLKLNQPFIPGINFTWYSLGCSVQVFLYSLGLNWLIFHWQIWNVMFFPCTLFFFPDFDIMIVQFS